MKSVRRTIKLSTSDMKRRDDNPANKKRMANAQSYQQTTSDFFTLKDIKVAALAAEDSHDDNDLVIKKPIKRNHGEQKTEIKQVEEKQKIKLYNLQLIKRPMSQRTLHPALDEMVQLRTPPQERQQERSVIAKRRTTHIIEVQEISNTRGQLSLIQAQA